MTDGGHTMTEAWNLQLQARIEQLEKALKPFSDYGAILRGQKTRHDLPILQLWNNVLTGDDFIAATKAFRAEEPPEIPVGAIENGRVFMQRLEEHYKFECDGGSLANCQEWTELKRCFEHMAESLRK